MALTPTLRPLLTPLRALAACSLLALGSASAHAQALPGQGTKVQPVQSSIAEETFQTLLVARALAKLGYTVQATKEVEYPTAHVAIANGDAVTTLIRNFRQDGHAFWNEFHLSPVRNAAGRVTHYIGYQLDVTERVERDQQLEQLAS